MTRLDARVSAPDANQEGEALLSGNLDEVERYDISSGLIARGSRLHALAS